MFTRQTVSIICLPTDRFVMYLADSFCLFAISSSGSASDHVVNIEEIDLHGLNLRLTD